VAGEARSEDTEPGSVSAMLISRAH